MNAEIKKKVELREARIEDIPGIWKLCSKFFDEFRGCSCEDFSDLCIHRWKDNPARMPEHVFGWVLETADKEITGFLGLVPMKVKIGNNIASAASGTSWAVETAYRAYSFDLYKRFMAWGDKNFLLDTTAAEVVANLHSCLKLGMNKIPIQGFDKKFLWVLKSEVLISSRIKEMSMRNKLWAVANSPFFIKICSFLLDVRFFCNRRINFKCSRLTVEAVGDFTDEFDRFWNDNKQDYAITIARDKAFLAWRHLKIPKIAGKSFVFACRDKGKLLGYAAVQKIGYQNSKPGHFVLSDVFYKLDHPDVFYNLMNYAFDFIKNSGGSIFEVFGFNPMIMNELKKQSPVEEQVFRRTYWYKAPTKEILDLCREGDWWPSGSDGDLNL